MQVCQREDQQFLRLVVSSLGQRFPLLGGFFSTNTTRAAQTFSDSIVACASLFNQDPQNCFNGGQILLALGHPGPLGLLLVLHSSDVWEQSRFQPSTSQVLMSNSRQLFYILQHLAKSNVFMKITSFLGGKKSHVGLQCI